MTTSEHRKGLRLPWLGDDARTTEPPEASPEVLRALGVWGPLPEPAAPGPPDDALAAPPSPPEAPTDEPAANADPFLASLVDAMRRIAETTGDDTVAGLRKAMAARAADIRAATEVQAAELKASCASDVKLVGAWERAEIAGIRAEAGDKVAARQRLLEADLAQNLAAGERAAGVVEAGIAAYEADLRAFFADLAMLRDPVAFATAAKRMPPPPDVAWPRDPDPEPKTDSQLISDAAAPASGDEHAAG